VDARRAPQGIRRSHLPDECGDVGADGRASAFGPARKAGPILTEASPLPPENSIRRHDDQRVSPASPESGQTGPE
jgi:hypothetical protein